MNISTLGRDSSYQNRHTAFEVVELFVYYYAIASVVVGSRVWELNTSPSYAGTYFLIVTAFLVVVARNYVVMQSIDKDESTISESYRFVEVQEGVWIYAERTIRLALIAVVVLAPKSYGILTYPMRELGGAIELLFISVGSSVNLNYVPQSSPLFHDLHDDLIYYGSVLFTFAITSMLWDLISMISFKTYVHKQRSYEVSRGQPTLSAADVLQTSVHHSTVANDVYRSLLMYMNVYRVRRRSGELRAELEVPQWTWLSQAVESGRVLAIYLVSWKFIERTSLVVLSLIMILVAAANLSSLPVLLLGFALVVYLLAASKNQRYLKDLGNFAVFWIFYWTSRSTIVAPIISFVERDTD